MENASKALIIAGAILLSILLISLGIMIFNQAQDTVGSINMSEQEIQAFNNKFIPYEGSNKRGTEVNALIQLVRANNQAASDDGAEEKIITIKSTKQGVNTNGGVVTGTVTTGSTYTVDFTYKNGLVNVIDIK
ncbi:MAG: hypothetical protein HFJ40_05090 [Clostridia bacterium]|nr:hypothetical protein [Clostridia bacterium]